MRLHGLGFALIFSSPLLALDSFEIVSDTTKKVHGEVFKGICEVLEQKEKDINKEDGLLGAVKNAKNWLAKEVTEKDCNTVGPVVLAAKAGTKRSTHTILAGQRAVFFKDVSGAEALRPAICYADPTQPGRILLLQTPKSETARSWLGKSLGYGLKCTQVENIP